MPSSAAGALPVLVAAHVCALALLPGVARAGCSATPLGCHKDASTRLLRYHLKGCPADANWGDTRPAPGQATAPACAAAKVSLEYCTAACDAWRPWGAGGAFFVGLESGVGVPDARPDYAECVCDGAFAAPPPLPASACPATCPGAAPGSEERCGGAPGTRSRGRWGHLEFQAEPLMQYVSYEKSLMECAERRPASG